jgi:DNA helicase-2/ATP-dependent DNA helicase PcrA
MTWELNKYQKEAVDHLDGPCLVTSCPGSGKCVIGDTLVCSEKELISEIRENAVDNIIGLSSENLSDISVSSKDISEFVDSGYHKTIKLTTKNGYTIEGTYNHPIVVINKDGKFVWRKLKDINKQDFCPIWVNNKKAFNYELDEKYYLIGLLIGDGCLVRKRCLSFHSEKNNIAKYFCEIVKKYYQYDCKIYKDKRRSNLYSYNIFSVKIKKEIEKEFGDIFHYACDKYLTPEILSSSKNQIASVIRGIYDTDGSASDNICDLILCSKKIIDQLHILLLHYGIFSTKTIKRVKNKDYYRIQIFGNNYRRFVNNIGFEHAKKLKISQNILEKEKNSNQIIPFAQSKMENIMRQLSSYNCEWYERATQTLLSDNGNLRLARYKAKDVKNTRNITEDSVNRIKVIFDENGYYDSNFEHIKNLNNYCYSEIIKIEYSKNKKHVYDYVVPKTHSFIANGFVNHNTFTIVERLVKLVQMGVKQKNILCLTFTNKAANEMKERICKRLGVNKLDFFCGTFHAMCARLIRKVGAVKGYQPNFIILDEKDQIDLIMQIARRKECNIEYGDARRIAHGLNYYRDQMEDFSWVEDDLKTDVLIEIAKTYIEKCRNDNLIDFSGLIYESIHIIEDSEELRKKIQNTFKYIMVDETQDTNKSQFYLVNLLAKHWRNIMLVGDIDQSIYGWRGARYQNIQDFMNDYDDCRVISLSKNYRSTPQIVKAASKLIKYNSSHMGTSFETDNEDGEPVKCFSFKDQLVEANCIGLQTKRLVNEGGWDPQDIAVLYRVNKMSEPVEQAMVNNGIPYEVIGAWNFYDRKEIKDCLSMLKLLSNPKDGISFHRLCSLIPGMGDITVGKIENIAHDKNISIIQACQEMKLNARSSNIVKACDKIYDIYNYKWDIKNPASCLKKLIEYFSYDKYLLEKFEGSATERRDNVEQLVDSAGEFMGEDGLSKYLHQVSLVTDNDKDKTGNKVSLMSLHAAKGLEFPIVFMIGVENEIIPHKNALADDPYAGLEEERRLMFVGMTRAKKLLYLSWCKNRRKFGKYGNMTYNMSKPSQFLKEAGVLQEE